MSSDNDILVELPSELMDKVAEVMPDLTVNLPLMDETEKPFFPQNLFSIPQNFFSIPQNFFSIPQNFFSIPQNFFIKNTCLQIIFGLLLLLLFVPEYLSTFYGYFLIIFLFVSVLRNTN